eukprot:GHVL01007095.1.p1 GENE.GHVL01007095.1~~GHVL01007095.1.p1  ORF type:complete len:450 (+),score=72.15 GHVL01007095.1:38-1387(+)
MSHRKVAYFYDPDIGSYYYGKGHPMKPQRIKMTHSLVNCFELYKDMSIFRPHQASESELANFHEQDYVDFLKNVTPDANREIQGQLKRFGLAIAQDCPAFEGVYEFQTKCCGASIDAAHKIKDGFDISINWSGGLHHAKRGEASGFCYMNDIVLSILELLKWHSRVLYLDIDIHHGDGVEEAFYTTNRVMTVSFHKFGDFFPGTGDVDETGVGVGKYYSVNVPLNDGITDDMFFSLFQPITNKAVEVYKPGVVVLQCGADSLAGDRLGKFNLSSMGHSRCVKHCVSFNLPLVLLGGGGYTIRNVARCWAYETAVAVGRDTEISADDVKIPVNDFWEYFAPDHQLHVCPQGDVENKNTAATIQAIQTKILQNFKNLEFAPGIQFAHVAPDFFSEDNFKLQKYLQQEENTTLENEWSGGGVARGNDEKIERARISRTGLTIGRPDGTKVGV